VDKKEVLDEIILGYRRLITDRYQYGFLKDNFDLPDSFDEDRVNRFRTFFLDNIYPEPQKRDELNEAFESLDDYIKHTDKLLRLLVESAKLLFKHGRHLPKILSAGIKALRSFRSANTFEFKLVDVAIASGKSAPYSSSDMENFISLLNKKDIEGFIKNSRSLFETLHDRVLVQKIKEIVNHLISKMKSNPKLYSQQEISGLELGRDIINGGDSLFEELSKDEQFQIFEFVVTLEQNVMEDLFSRTS